MNSVLKLVVCAVRRVPPEHSFLSPVTLGKWFLKLGAKPTFTFVSHPCNIQLVATIIFSFD